MHSPVFQLALSRFHVKYKNSEDAATIELKYDFIRPIMGHMSW